MKTIWITYTIDGRPQCYDIGVPDTAEPGEIDDIVAADVLAKLEWHWDVEE